MIFENNEEFVFKNVGTSFEYYPTLSKIILSRHNNIFKDLVVHVCVASYVDSFRRFPQIVSRKRRICSEVYWTP